MAETAAVVYYPLRVVSGRFTTGIASSTSNLRGLLPHSRQPIGRVQPDGSVLMDTVWYSFFQRFFDVFLGGAGVYTLQDVINAVESTRTANADLLVLTNSVAQQALEASNAVNVVREVVVGNSLTGADQIPRVRTNGIEP